MLLAVVVGMLAGCGQHPGLSVVAALPAECEGDASHCEVLTRFQGVNVYRNIGPGGFCTEGGCIYPSNAYGTRWQCVELFSRFFALRFGTPPIRARAKDLLDQAAGIDGLEVRANGGALRPLPGDALVFGGPSPGHVAIVTRTTAQEVRVVEQNTTGDGTGTYSYDTETNTVGALDTARPVLGWIHAVG